IKERPCQPVVVVIHHTGKDKTKGGRGHSNLRDTADVELSVSGTKAAVTVAMTKGRGFALATPITVAITGSPPTLQPRRWALAEIIHAGIALMPGGEFPGALQSRIVRRWAATAMPPWTQASGPLSS